MFGGSCFVSYREDVKWATLAQMILIYTNSVNIFDVFCYFLATWNEESYVFNCIKDHWEERSSLVLWNEQHLLKCSSDIFWCICAYICMYVCMQACVCMHACIHVSIYLS